jgi:hypothetical protein
VSSGGSSLVGANYVYAGSKLHWVAGVTPVRTTPGSLATGIWVVIDPLTLGAAGIMNAQLAARYKGRLRAAIEGMGFNVTGVDITGNVNAHAAVEAITPMDRNNISDIRGDFTAAARQVGLMVSDTDNYLRVISKPSGAQGGSDVRVTGNELDNKKKDDPFDIGNYKTPVYILGAVLSGLAIKQIFFD